MVFRSRLREGVDKGRLGDLDREAHGEAVEGGGLLKYWFGDGDEGGFNLATCRFLFFFFCFAGFGEV